MLVIVPVIVIILLPSSCSHQLLMLSSYPRSLAMQNWCRCFSPLATSSAQRFLSSKIYLAPFKRSPKLYTITHPRCLLTARLTRASALALSVLTIPHLLRWRRSHSDDWLISDCQLFLAYPWFYHHHTEKPRLRLCICLMLESLPLLFSLQPNIIRLRFKFGSNQAKFRGFTYMSKPHMSKILFFKNSLLSDDAENFLILRLRYRRWMVSKSGWSGWRSNWRNQGRSTDRTRLLLLLTLLLQRTRGETEENNSILFFVWTYSFLDFSSFFERKTKEETKHARYARAPSHQVLFMMIESHVIHLSKKIELFLQKTQRWSRMRRRCTSPSVDCHLNQIFSQIFKQIRQWFLLSTLSRHFL